MAIPIVHRNAAAASNRPQSTCVIDVSSARRALPLPGAVCSAPVIPATSHSSEASDGCPSYAASEMKARAVASPTMEPDCRKEIRRGIGSLGRLREGWVVVPSAVKDGRKPQAHRLLEVAAMRAHVALGCRSATGGARGA